MATNTKVIEYESMYHISTQNKTQLDILAIFTESNYPYVTQHNLIQNTKKLNKCTKRAGLFRLLIDFELEVDCAPRVHVLQRLKPESISVFFKYVYV